MTDSSKITGERGSHSDLTRWVNLATARVVERCDLLAQSTDDPDRLTRTFCSPAMNLAHGQLRSWFGSANLESELDSLGNLIGKSRQFDHPAPGNDIFMIGSHIDTVVDAGRFDGALGVLLGLGAVEVVRAADIDLGFDIHVVAFSEEEGVRYKMPFIGSSGIAGTFDPVDLARVDADGITMADALTSFGCQPKCWKSACYSDRNLIGFLEAHMEQATLLQESNLAVGVVDAIAGQTRATIKMTGRSGHAGTVPHDRRQDALAAAADLILKIEKLGQKTDGLFATVGDLQVSPGLSNVIPGGCELRLDLRHPADDVRQNAFDEIKDMIDTVGRSRDVTGSIVSVQHSPAVPMSQTITNRLNSAIVETGLESKALVSGAGHDAMIMSNVAPSGMLFVRCREGISHHPDEFVSPEDISIALEVIVRALMGISKMRSSEYMQ